MAAALGGSGGAKRVVRTGLALVHANEIVYPAAGSQAMATRAVEDAQTSIEVHFPVVIEVTAAGPAPGSSPDEALRDHFRHIGALLRPR